MLEEKDPDQKKTRPQREREEEDEEEVIKRNGSEEDGSKKTGFQTGDSARISFRRCHPYSIDSGSIYSSLTGKTIKNPVCTRIAYRGCVSLPYSIDSGPIYSFFIGKTPKYSGVPGSCIGGASAFLTVSSLSKIHPI